MSLEETSALFDGEEATQKITGAAHKADAKDGSSVSEHEKA